MRIVELHAENFMGVDVVSLFCRKHAVERGAVLTDERRLPLTKRGRKKWKKAKPMPQTNGATMTTATYPAAKPHDDIADAVSERLDANDAAGAWAVLDPLGTEQVAACFRAVSDAYKLRPVRLPPGPSELRRAAIAGTLTVMTAEERDAVAVESQFRRLRERRRHLRSCLAARQRLVEQGLDAGDHATGLPTELPSVGSVLAEIDTITAAIGRASAGLPGFGLDGLVDTRKPARFPADVLLQSNDALRLSDAMLAQVVGVVGDLRRNLAALLDGSSRLASRKEMDQLRDGARWSLMASSWADSPGVLPAGRPSVAEAATEEPASMAGDDDFAAGLEPLGPDDASGL